jgi:hypothetical protein
VEYIRGEDNAADILSRPLVSAIHHSNSVEDEGTRNRILAQYHQMLGHGPAASMKFAIGQKYTWDGLYKDIEAFAEACTICCRAGGPRTNTRNRAIKASAPNELWFRHHRKTTYDRERHQVHLCGA